MDALEILRRAQAILMGTPVAKATGDNDPDDLAEGSDARAASAAPTDDSLTEARKEAQSAQPAPGEVGPDGQPAPGAPGEGAAHEAGEGVSEESEEHASGEEEADESVSKADILQSIRFFARSNGIEPDEIVKAFSGTEGNPAKGPAPLGQGVELLEKISIGLNAQGKVLEAIAGALLDLSTNQVKLGGELAKSVASSEAAIAAAAAAEAKYARLPRVSDALPSKGQEIFKAEGSDRPLTGADVMKMAMSGQLSPTEAAALNRKVNQATAPR